MSLEYEHIHIVHTDHDAALQFYKDFLGAEVVNSVQRHGAPQTKIMCGGSMLIIRGIRPGEDPMAAGTLPRMGVDHIGFHIGAGEYEAQKKRLLDAGVAILEEGDLPHLRYMYFAGPDGVTLEFMEPKPGS